MPCAPSPTTTSFFLMSGLRAWPDVLANELRWSMGAHAAADDEQAGVAGAAGGSLGAGTRGACWTCCERTTVPPCRGPLTLPRDATSTSPLRSREIPPTAPRPPTLLAR